MKVLIIEDDQPLANILAAYMERVSARVVLAGTLKAARSVLEKPNGFDVVFLDLTLPDSFREATLEAVRWIKRTGRKVVIITGSSEPVDEVASQCGADGCFYKHDPHFREKVMEQLNRQ